MISLIKISSQFIFSSFFQSKFSDAFLLFHSKNSNYNEVPDNTKKFYYDTSTTKLNN